jgi:hypothetical protein
VENSAEGWRSRFYSQREPALSLSVTTDAAEANFWSLFSPINGAVTLSETAIQVHTTSGLVTITLGRDDEPLAVAIRSVGPAEETLQIPK